MSVLTPVRRASRSGKPELRRTQHTWVLRMAGWIFLVLGIAGFILPVMPGTVFLIISLWCFSRSSPEMRHWMLSNPAFGHHLVNWESHRVIPARAKCLAGLLMLASVLFLVILQGISVWTTGVAAFLALLFLWMLRYPGTVAQAETGDRSQRLRKRT